MHRDARAYPSSAPGRAISLLAAAALAACAPAGSLAPERLDELLRHPAKRAASYGAFDPSTALAARVVRPPDVLIEAWRAWDGRSDYQAYLPAADEMAVLEDALDTLPALMRATLRERLIGIYFIQNFLGSGLADWVRGPDGELLLYLAFNPEVLRHDISTWLTRKEESAFEPDRGDDLRLAIDCGRRLSGAHYILLHEGAHAVDYIHHLTPWVEPVMLQLGQARGPDDFVRGIWSDLRTPRQDLAWRARVSFYGLGGGPRLARSEAAAIYADLATTPFASLYGSLSWAEDLAELVTFHHLTGALGQPYRIYVKRGGQPILRLEPLASERVRARLPLLERLYHEPRPPL